MNGGCRAAAPSSSPGPIPTVGRQVPNSPSRTKPRVGLPGQARGGAGIGWLLISRGGGGPGPTVEGRLPVPPPLCITAPFHLAPLRHALTQVDGAAVFGPDGVVRRLGVRLVPSAAAEESVDALKGTRHTSGRRYSYDDPRATVIAVSDDGPVSVLRNGEVLGRSAR